ncbi:hypothetical protein EVA_09768 [gut metagenome]|uniref:Uncharacterized protein n=1 Tax=gut metagenome TaxID=749906 RepID=J9G4K1_9ZZZZ
MLYKLGWCHTAIKQVISHEHVNGILRISVIARCVFNT